MGYAKDQDIQERSKYDHAAHYCKLLDAVEECEIHEDECLINTDAYDDADPLVMAILAKYPKALEHFDNQEEMGRFVQQVLDDAGNSCGACAQEAEG